MKKYLLMGQASGIGGWQLYMDARLTYLSERSIDVYLVSITDEAKNKIELASLAKSHHLCIPAVHMPPAAYSKNQREKIISRILSFVDCSDHDDVFIEATDMPLSMWGEILAERVNAVNFAYLLHSHIENVSNDVQEFFYFKYKHNMLAGMSDLTLPELFKGYADIPNDDTRKILAVPRDPLTDDNGLEGITDEMHSFRITGGRIISYFGNLTKPHFTQVCDAVSDYVAQHRADKFMFISIGSSALGKAESYQLKVETVNQNCICKNIPAMYPVPRRLFEEMSVCIASWGCADLAARAKALTIRLMDDITIFVQGIMGITVNGLDCPLMPASEQSIYEFLDEVLYSNKYTAADIEPIDVALDFREYERGQDKLMKPFENREALIQYYNIDRIRYVNPRASLEKMMNIILGTKITQKAIEFVKAITVKNS